MGTLLLIILTRVRAAHTRQSFPFQIITGTLKNDFLLLKVCRNLSFTSFNWILNGSESARSGQRLTSFRYVHCSSLSMLLFIHIMPTSGHQQTTVSAEDLNQQSYTVLYNIMYSIYVPPVSALALVLPEHGHGEEGAVTHVAGPGLVVFCK